MASVHAPNHTFLPDFLNRIRCFDQSTAIEELQCSPLPIKAPNHGVMQQQKQRQSVDVFHEMGLKDSTTHDQSQNNIMLEGFNMNMGNKRMRTTVDHNSCDQEEAFIRMAPFFMDLPGMAPAPAPHLFTPGRPPVVSTGLRLSTNVSLDDSRPCSTSSNSHLPSSAFRPILDTPLPFLRQMQAHLAKQSGELHCLIESQAERMKQTIEEKLQLHTRGLIAKIEGNMSKRLKAKDEELEKAHRKSLQLEERLKQLTVEAQLWRNLAKNNELMAVNLRQSLEQVVVVQARNQQKNCHMYHANHISREEGCGESSEVDDAESCQAFGDHRAPVNVIGADKELLEKRKCKVCRVNEVCMLLLPCRHLCLCRDCEKPIDACPSCGTTKNASVQVYMA